MEDPEIRRRKIKHERKKERAGSTAPDGEGESPPTKKRKIRKLSREDDDIIDGFSIRSFKTWEDCLVSFRLNSYYSTLSERQFWLR